MTALGEGRLGSWTVPGVQDEGVGVEDNRGGLPLRWKTWEVDCP